MTQSNSKEESSKTGFAFGGKSDSKVEEPKKDEPKKDEKDQPKPVFGFGNATSSNKKDDKPPALAGSVPVQPGEYLKNKSFEDIIAKWTSALTKSVDRFKDQAAKTAKWDQILVDNGTKIADIYNEIMVAEQAQTRIDDVLGYVGHQQDDIDAMLTQLEKQTSPTNATGLALETLQPFDKERFDAYNLADQLTSKLDNLEGSLTSIIGEMNNLTRETHHIKESDPVADIVKILNSHLASLQYIDESANALQKKLVEVHMQSSRIKM